MGGPGFTEKRVRIEEINPDTLNVESGSTRTEIKYWVERLFGVKVRGMNSHRLLRKRFRMRPSMGHRMHYRRLIITLQPSYSILIYEIINGYERFILDINLFHRYLEDSWIAWLG